MTSVEEISKKVLNNRHHHHHHKNLVSLVFIKHHHISDLRFYWILIRVYICCPKLFNDSLSGVIYFIGHHHYCEVVILSTLTVDTIMNEKKIPYVWESKKCLNSMISSDGKVPLNKNFLIWPSCFALCQRKSNDPTLSWTRIFQIFPRQIVLG